MDVCGHDPAFNRENRYILVITVHITEWAVAYAMPNQEQTNIAFCLKQYLNTFGYFEIILTNRGRNFESSLI